MVLSVEGLAKIAKNEGCSLKPYPDHKGYSIGHGHLMTDAERVKYADGITAEQANLLLHKDCTAAMFDVSEHVRFPVTQEQFDALVDFRYNEGLGPLLHVCETLNTGRVQAAVARLKLYNKAHDQFGELVEVPGLTARRAQEAEAFKA